MRAPVLVTKPAAKALDIARARLHLRIDTDDEDALLEGMIDGAIAHLDGWAGVLGRCLVNQTWRLDLDRWPCRLRLPFPDVSEVSITYRDVTGATQTLDESLYRHAALTSGDVVDFIGGLPPVDTAGASPIAVTLVAGYGAAADDVPAALRIAMLLLLAHWWEHREAVGAATLTELPLGVAALIAPYRRIGV